MCVCLCVWDWQWLHPQTWVLVVQYRTCKSFSDFIFMRIRWNNREFTQWNVKIVIFLNKWENAFLIHLSTLCVAVQVVHTLASLSSWRGVFVPKQIRFKSQASPAGREPALQIYWTHFIISANKYLSYCALSKGDFMNMYAAWHVNYTWVKYHLHVISVSEGWTWTTWLWFTETFL